MTNNILNFYEFKFLLALNQSTARIPFIYPLLNSLSPDFAYVMVINRTTKIHFCWLILVLKHVLVASAPLPIASQPRTDQKAINQKEACGAKNLTTH